MPTRLTPRAHAYLEVVLVLLLAGGMLAMILTASTSSSSGLSLVPGSDSSCAASPVYPCATVSIDGTGTVEATRAACLAALQD